MSVNIDRESSEAGASPPVYQRIQRHFLDRITGGELKIGDRLPTEIEIAKEFGTSRATVQSAMSRLVYEGWIEKQAGRGTFVADAGRSALIDLDSVRSFEEDVLSHGDHVNYQLLNVGREKADDDVADRLGIDSGTTILAFERLRVVGNEIIGMERRFFAPGISLDFPVDALDTESTHSLVQGYLKQKIGRMDVAIRAVAADHETAEKLNVTAGSPLLLRRHTMYSTEGEVILFGEAFYCAPFAFRYTAESHHDI